jgi:tetratricopeptide (TPR) repeat protein
MNNIGAELDALGKKSDAIPWFEKAAKCDPDEELYRNNVKSTQKELAAQTRENQCDALFDKGRGQDKAGDHQGAIGTYKQLLSLCPKNCSAMNNIGVRFDELGNKSDAIPWFEKAAQCDPGNKTYEKNLTATKRELAELQQQASNKSQCDSLFQSGLAKSKAGDKQGAVTIYRKVLSVCPDHCMAMNNIGAALDSMGSRSQAIPWFEKASACDPGNSLFKKNTMLTKQEIAAQPTPATPKQSSALPEVKPGPPSAPNGESYKALFFRVKDNKDQSNANHYLLVLPPNRESTISCCGVHYAGRVDQSGNIDFKIAKDYGVMGMTGKATGKIDGDKASGTCWAAAGTQRVQSNWSAKFEKAVQH